MELQDVMCPCSPPVRTCDETLAWGNRQPGPLAFCSPAWKIPTTSPTLKSGYCAEKVARLMSKENNRWWHNWCLLCLLLLIPVPGAITSPWTLQEGCSLGQNSPLETPASSMSPYKECPGSSHTDFQLGLSTAETNQTIKHFWTLERPLDSLTMSPEMLGLLAANNRGGMTVLGTARAVITTWGRRLGEQLNIFM